MRTVDAVLFDKTGTLTKGAHVVTGVAAVDGRQRRGARPRGRRRSRQRAPARPRHRRRRRRIGACSRGAPTSARSRAAASRPTVDGRASPSAARLLRETASTEPGRARSRRRQWARAAPPSCPSSTTGTSSGAGARGRGPPRVAGGRASAARARRRVVMITGDARQVADAVAAELGVDEVFAEVLPEDKDAKVAGLQQPGTVVAMVGDGVNDAPALARADVGIAIGAGTDVAIESAGVVLASSDPRAVVGVIRLSRASYRKMVQNLVLGRRLQHRRDTAGGRRARLGRRHAGARRRRHPHEPVDDRRRPQRQLLRPVAWARGAGTRPPAGSSGTPPPRPCTAWSRARSPARSRRTSSGCTQTTGRVPSGASTARSTRATCTASSTGRSAPTVP